MRKTILSSILLCHLMASSVFAYSISVVPPSGGIAVGATGQVNVNLSLNPGEELFGFNFALAYNPELLTLQSLTFGDGLGDYVTGYTSESNQITFDGALFGLSGATSSMLPLTALSFTAINQGTDTLSLTGAVLDMNQSSETLLSAISTVDLYSPSPAPVPEPGTAVLLGSVFAGLLLFRKTRTA